MKSRLIVLVLVALTGAPSRAHSAEWFGSLYAGTVATGESPLTIDKAFPAPGYIVTRDSRFMNSGLAGVEVGRWEDRYPAVGWAFAASHFRADASNVRMRLNPLTALGLARMRFMKNEPRFPNGRLQPYAGLGFSITLSRTSADFRPEAPQPITYSAGGAGFEARTGIAWFWLPQVAMLGEYRYMMNKIQPSIGDHEGMHVTLRTHQGAVGIRYQR